MRGKKIKLNGGASIWWEYLKDVNGLKESKIT
jgi:hypothetical protein